MKPKRMVDQDFLNYVIGRATRNIIDFPTGAKLPGMVSPLTEGEIRVLAIIEATLSASVEREDVDLAFIVPDSSSINEQ